LGCLRVEVGEERLAGDENDSKEEMMRRIVLALMTVAALAAPAALASGSFPETIPLPTGFQPEGIAIGTGDTFYVGSIPTGAVFAGNVRTGAGRIIVEGAAGRAATGMKYDNGLLWVSGAATGKAFVYDVRTGELVREYQLATGSGPTFINDVVVTEDAAYFTDSNRAVLYKVALSSKGVPGDASDLPLSGDFELVDGFNLNGIAATADGHTLLAVQSATGKLFAIDAESGVARTVDLGGAVLAHGDGLLLHGRTLYVVQNTDNQIAVVKLAHDVGAGAVARTITDADFDVPTTIGRFGHRLYAVNARFGIDEPEKADYDVVQVGR
jgi:outer membrane protein assembly factor BamB